MSAGPDRATLEAAAEWYAELRDAGPESPVHDAHGEWLDRNPMHRRAWERVEKLKARLDSTPPHIVQPTLKKARAAKRKAVKLLSFLLLIGSALAVWLQTDFYHFMTADHYAGTGEHNAVHLPDGSLIVLNTNSAVDVHFDAQHRRIHLRQGEIHVTTAHDMQSRPFTVTTGRGQIRALGTRFLVRSEDAYDRVSVLEHAVEIRPASAPDRVKRLDAGKQTCFSAQSVDPATLIAGKPDAWTRGQLIVSDWSLGQFLDELSRYHPGILSYDDATAGLQISGAFHLGEIDAVLNNLAATLPVRIQRFTPYWTRVEPVNP